MSNVKTCSFGETEKTNETPLIFLQLVAENTKIFQNIIGRKIKKVVFITTLTFSGGAIQYARNVENKIILVDGDQLTKYMIENGIGVSEVAYYRINKIDLDYFTEE